MEKPKREGKFVGTASMVGPGIELHARADEKGGDVSETPTPQSVFRAECDALKAINRRNREFYQGEK